MQSTSIPYYHLFFSRDYNKTYCGPGLHPPSCDNVTYPSKEGKYYVAAKIEDWKAISEDETIIA